MNKHTVLLFSVLAVLPLASCGYTTFNYNNMTVEMEGIKYAIQ